MSIQEVLQKFDNTYDEVSFEVREYGIRFITSDGRLRTMAARKNGKSPGSGSRKPVGGVLYNLQRTGTMLVSEGAKSKAIKPATICGFKDHKSDTWQTVYH